MTDVDHGADHRAGVDAENFTGKLLHAGFVDGFGGGGHRGVPSGCGSRL
jgi:hypothetical protein